ncbi:MAG: hypothetical protein CFE34_15590 [Rhodobacteraceae bacterium PARR1]|nr:MAG: hypothetical protein CFE34_15590 [Rhodobacteraceae bacterium PARR1]
MNGNIDNVVVSDGGILTGSMSIGNGVISSGVLIAPVASTLGGSAPHAGSLAGVFYGPNAEAVQGGISTAIGSAPTNGFFVAER